MKLLITYFQKLDCCKGKIGNFTDSLEIVIDQFFFFLEHTSE